MRGPTFDSLQRKYDNELPPDDEENEREDDREWEEPEYDDSRLDF